MAQLSLAFGLLIWSGLAAAAAPRIGAAAAVQGKVEALAPQPGAAARALQGGLPVFLDERVSTGRDSSAQLLLLDESAFTIGPESSLRLDRFVYDPDRGTGEAAAEILKGSFRFVTGAIGRGKPQAVKVKTPVGTIGIFGTIVAGLLDGEKGTFVLLGPGDGNDAGERPGRVRIETPRGVVELTRPGYASTVRLGQAPTPPALLPAGALEALLRALGASAMSGRIPPETGRALAAVAGSGLPRAEGLATLAGGEPVALLASALEQAGLKNLQDVARGQFSLWDDVRRLPGNASFAGSGAFTAGSICFGGAQNCTGSWGYNLLFDFNARTITASANIATTNIPLAALGPTVINYSSLAGQASFSASFAGAGGTARFDWKVLGREGTPAEAVSGSASFSSPLNSGVGQSVLTLRKP